MNEYTIADITVGQCVSFQREITAEMEDMFREITGDENPLHWSDTFAKETSGGKYPHHVAFGMLTASLLSTLAGVYLPGKYSLIHSIETGFVNPVYAGDMLTVWGECVDKQEGLHLITLKVWIKNAAGKTVAKGKMKIIVTK